MSSSSWGRGRLKGIFFGLLWFCGFCCQILAQTRQLELGQIAVEGATRFSSSQVASASGLKSGQQTDDAALNSAADRLAQTGAFSEVTYRYKTLNGKIAVTFQVVDTPKTIACTFDNFVWFAADEIDRAARAEVPLYDGRVPLNGDLAGAVTTALEHLLAQHNIKATVTYLPAAKSIGSAPTEFRYSANGNLPLVTSAEFTGGPLDSGLFAVAKQRLMGKPFSAAYARSLAENDLQVIYQNHAYLRAHYGDPQVAFQPGSSDSEPGNVKVVFTVEPGPQFSWHGSEWAGNSLYPSMDLDRLLGMKEGELAAADKISAGMDAVHDSYGRKGYIAAGLSPKQDFDDTARQVHYSFEVKEGSQYHMGTLTVTGFDSQTSERIRSAWRLKSGDIYDAGYLKEFGRKDFPAAVSGNPAAKSAHTSFSVHPNPESLAVDVGISVSAN